MEAEDTLRLFDCYWYEFQLFKKQQQENSQPSSYNSISETNPGLTFPKKPAQPSESSSSSSSMGSRTMSYSSFSKSCQRLDSLSPNSILFAPTATETHQTFNSGKVTDNWRKGKPEQIIAVRAERVEHRTVRSCSGEKRRKKKGLSKSLSDLEFEELKGFMDLGFVFSEEDKENSILASIIPGLQKLGKKEDDADDDGGDGDGEEVDGGEVDDDDDDDSRISRPYLSEAWEGNERRKKENSMFSDWRVPATISSEIDMKDYLRCWAHSVASSVR